MKYSEFLQGKVKGISDAGFTVHEENMNRNLFDFQRYIVKKALQKGRYAVFADCGLGKTLMQLEWANQVSMHTGKPVLILAPLAVSGQTIQEGERFGIPVKAAKNNNYIFSEGLYITNYEQLENIEASAFAGVVLDESSILKSFDGATTQLIIERFAHTPYKLACTATPSPNDYTELGNHAEFLGVMKRVEMLAMYFVHDAGSTSEWRLKGHGEKVFFGWVSSWSAFVSNPSDLGFDGTKYVLPPLNFIEKQIATPVKDEGRLFNDTAISATEFSHELRITIVPRLEEVANIVNNSTEPFLVWCKLNDEADVLCNSIYGAVEVRGNEKPDAKEAKLLGFGRNEFRVMVTKTKIAQYGLNYQHCHNQVFASLDFSFEGLYQAIRRSYRFGQTQPVNIYIVTTDTMQNVIQAIKQKERLFEKMKIQMNVSINQNHTEFMRQEGREIKNENYHIINGDCVQEISRISDNSVGLSVFSPPFAELYTYSNNCEDMGNSNNYDEFVKHFSYLVSELQRVTMSGRNVAVHCMDIPAQKWKDGHIGLKDFSGMIIRAFEENGFVYHSRVTLWKNPVVEMQRTKALGLLHKQIKKNAAMSRVGIPDYLIVFRKDGEAQSPVRCNIPVDLWRKWASPVWMDIEQGKTLNGISARHENDEKHICPLQLDTIERAIQLWSNEGDTVFTPFMGIGSEVYKAVELNRYGIGIELKESYFDVAAKNVEKAVSMKIQEELFLV